MKYLIQSTIILIISSILFLLIDFFFGIYILSFVNSKMIDEYNLYKLDKNLRIKNNFYHHDLKKNYKTLEVTLRNAYKYRVCTDKFGFKFSCSDIPKKDSKLAIIGDSFTEGIKLNYEDTFVGKLEHDLGTRIYNMGVATYSPKIYYTKIKKKINNDFKPRHIILALDISDIIDDTNLYDLKNEKVTDKKNKFYIKELLVRNFKLSYYFYNQIKYTKIYKDKRKIKLNIDKNFEKIFHDVPFEKKIITKQIIKKNYHLSKWVHNIDENRESIEESKKYLNKTFNFLEENKIKFSFLIYPWPSMIYNSENNPRFVEIWKDFCEKRCENFFDLVTPLVNQSEKLGKLNFIKKYYFYGDVHFNEDGNKLLAKELYKQIKN